ncbi:UPF0489 family protein [Maridesulfovibrio hydrothermalis]|uniref:Uncharacterized protein n=1 Tax=Maridesulfovibrio hydrothermalis AM13 = DSM 14728 TaxID=1121451 RepID=L0RDX3_9BACT|nr:UPF0489 family protein [Maridesulfovibrio hydrothermalis]CCO23781.1 conserved protein of unknown function [Maridesulfovibrio hydrothermalis AM13 = DSM 14728]
MGDWIVDFQGRNHSTAIKLNFLYRYENIFIMDNHRAALWCWLECLEKENNLNLFHVDRHYDALFSPQDYEHFPHDHFENISISEYLACGYDNEFFAVTPLFRWDNYLGLFVEKYRSKIDSWSFATHGKGAAPHAVSYTAYEPWEFPVAIGELSGNWIFNLDLDYYFGRMGSGQMGRLFTDEYIRDWGSSLRKSLDDGVIKVLTISMSPECTGGWDGAERALSVLTGGLGIEFTLPG